MKKFLAAVVVVLTLPLSASAVTVDELQAQLQALLAQIAALQGQGITAAPQSGAASCPNLTRNLSHGMRGDDVTQLQQLLISQNLLASDNATGFFGAMTEAAVKQFQCSKMSICSGSPVTNGYGAVGPRTRAAIRTSCTSTPISSPTPTSTPVPTTPPTPACTPLSPQTQTVSCPLGQTGSIIQTRTSSCPGPVWSNWQTTTNTCTAGQSASCAFNGQTIVHGASVTAYQTSSVPFGSQCVSQSRTCTNGVLSGSYGYASCTVSTPPPVSRADKKLSISGNNVYSPDVVIQNGLRYLYFGGWMNAGQTHDNIYRAQCGNLGDSCTGIQAVIDSFAQGFEHFNDPTLVTMPGGYYIMYGTGVLLGQDGFVTTNNKIYYTTSWTNDGVNWAAPTLVIDDAWLPSATIGPDGGVEVFANSTTNGVVKRYRLGTSGTVHTSGEPLVFSNGLNYLNVDVEYRPSLRTYQMFGERFDTKHIDYLTSTDGIHFDLKIPDIVTDQSAGVPFVRTPGQDVGTASWLYYAGTSDQSATQNKIYFQTWQ